MGFTEKRGLSNGLSVTFDNLFTSFPLLDELSKGGIGGLASINYAGAAPESFIKRWSKEENQCADGTRSNVV